MDFCGHVFRTESAGQSFSDLVLLILGPLGGSWGHLGAILEPLGTILGPLGVILKTFGTVLGPLGAIFVSPSPSAGLGVKCRLAGLRFLINFNMFSYAAVS